MYIRVCSLRTNKIKIYPCAKNQKDCHVWSTCIYLKKRAALFTFNFPSDRIIIYTEFFFILSRKMLVFYRIHFHIHFLSQCDWIAFVFLIYYLKKKKTRLQNSRFWMLNIPCFLFFFCFGTKEQFYLRPISKMTPSITVNVNNKR